MKSLYFEIDQIKNYQKQAKVLDRHHNASMKKWIKKDSFLIAKKKVLWALGGDIDNPKCGPNDTSGPDYDRLVTILSIITSSFVWHIFSSLYEYELDIAVRLYANLTSCTHVSLSSFWVFLEPNVGH